MRIHIISLTEKGRILSLKIAEYLSEKHTVERFCFHKHSDENSTSFNSLSDLIFNIFNNGEALIFISACGIAVRAVAPLVKSKKSDPAVLVIDDCGKFVIPILSGHIGGANLLSRLCSGFIGATPVITTATDVGERFSPDSFAKANDLIICDFSKAKEIAAAVLDGEKIGLVCDYEYKGLPEEFCTDRVCRSGLCISSDESQKPFEATLNLLPQNLVVGVGCKRNTPLEVIESQIFKTLNTNRLDFRRVCGIATIDIKSDEIGLLDFCRKYGISLNTYTQNELMSVNGDFTSSDFVKSRVGVDNVCERSAVLCSGGNIVVKKHAENGVTVAVAEKPIIIDFEREKL